MSAETAGALALADLPTMLAGSRAVLRRGASTFESTAADSTDSTGERPAVSPTSAELTRVAGSRSSLRSESAERASFAGAIVASKLAYETKATGAPFLRSMRSSIVASCLAYRNFVQYRYFRTT
jgi:hypothetical protein